MEKRTRRGKAVDEESEAILYQGANLSQLARLFGLDNRTVAARLHDVMPTGTRHGYDYWSIKEAAPHLCEAQFDLEDSKKLAEYIRRLNHTNLPKMLTKEFWAGMTARQRYEEAEGELWPTEKVSEVAIDMAKSIRTPLVLARDTVAAQTELTERQKQILNRIVDDALEALHDTVVKHFGEQQDAQDQESGL